MSILMLVEVDGVTLEQYERTDEALAASGAEHPEGLISHVAGVTDDGLVIADVWDSEESMRRFVDGPLSAALADTGGGSPGTPPRVLPVHNHIPQGSGTKAGVMIIIDAGEFGPDVYDEMTRTMAAHADGGVNHPAVSHVAARNEQGGLLVVDVWDSPESFGRFAETEIAPAGEKAGLGPLEPRFVPVHKHVAAKAGAAT